jgi:maltose alpha-D-glucosyltransferase/alpha-amylase
LSDEGREEAYTEFAPDEDMRAYSRGIRRRLAPMLLGDRRRLELTYSLLFSLPGTPVLRFGEEIGMGDDLSLAERASVRTPMQWSDEKNGGFSTASREKLFKPVISGGDYGYEKVNVALQQHDAHSLLNWMERLIRVRKECPEFGRGRLMTLESPKPGILLHCCECHGSGVLAVHNLTDRPVPVCLDLDVLQCEYLTDLLGDNRYERIEHPRELEIKGYGYRWFRLGGDRWKLP